MADSFQLKAILSAVDKLSPVLKNMQGVAKQTRKYLADIGSSASDVAGKVGMPFAALTGIATGGLFLAAKKAIFDFASGGAALDDLQKRTNETTDTLQLMAYQAEMSDVSVEGLHTAVAKLNKAIGEAAAGKNKELAALVAKLGISLRSANGQLRTAGELLPEIADAFKRNESPVTRARMGMAFFSKSYQEMLPMLVDGRAGLEQLRKEWERIGFTIPAEDIARAAALDDSFVRLRYATTGLFTAVGARLAPVVQPLVDRFVDWAAANRDILASRLTKMVDELAAGLQKVDFEKLLADVSSTAASVRDFVRSVGGMKTILIVLGALMAAGPLMSVVQLGLAVGKLGWFIGAGLFGVIMKVLPLLASFGGVVMSFLIPALQLLGGVLLGVFQLLMANPIVLAIAAIAAGAFLIIKNWDTVKAWFTQFFDWIGKKWEAFAGWFSELASTARSFLGLGGGGGAGVQAPVQGQGRRNSLATAGGGGRFGGTMAVEFRNAPAGMSVVDASSSAGFTMDASVGYRGFARDG